MSSSVAAPAPGGGGGDVVFQADAQDGAPLVVDPRLNVASVSTALTGTDGAGNPVTIHLNVQWTAIGPLQHTTDRTHVRFPKFRSPVSRGSTPASASPGSHVWI